MSNLLTIPREIRDEIYSWTLLDTLASSRSQLQRERITYSPSNPETLYGEEKVRYPIHISLPPAQALLCTTRQLRWEFLDNIKRRGPLKYKVDLTDRRDKGVLVPTWIHVPFLTDQIDILEVHWRVRNSKTSSIITYFCDDDEEDFQVDGFGASLALLERFIERGIYLLSKKKARKIHIRLLAIHLDRSDKMSELGLAEFVEETCEFLDMWMRGDVIAGLDEGARQREEAQFRLFASKIDKIQLHANGALKREWEISEMAAKRDSVEHVQNAELGDRDNF